MILSATIMPFNYIDYVKARKRIAPFTSRIIARTLMEVDIFLRMKETLNPELILRINQLDDFQVT